MISRFLTVIVALCAFLSVDAQFVLEPKWQANEAGQLEYTYSRYKTERDKPAEFDTVYALINTKYITQDAGAYYFEWYYIRYYDNAITAEELLPKVTSMAFTRFLSKAHVRFSVSKTDGILDVINQEELDSLQEVVTGTMVDSLEKEEGLELYQLMGLGTKFEIQLFDKLYGVIHDYYKVYSLPDIPLNKRLSIDEAGQTVLKQLDDVTEGYEGYALFTDTAAGILHLQVYLKADVSEAMMLLSDIADLALDLEDEKSGTPQSDTDETIPTSIMIVNLEIKMDKGAMHVSNYRQTENTNAGNTPFRFIESKVTEIRKVK